MLRAMMKGTVLLGFGRIPGGARWYRELTRNWMGTQGTHVDKLQRVWPGYVQIWQERCGLCLENLDVWVHEGGWTPFAPLMNYLLTGKGGVVTNTESRMLDRYLSRAVNGVLATRLPASLFPCERRQNVEALRWYDEASKAIAAIGGTVYPLDDSGHIPLASESIDLCHSGGALEHYRPDRLSAFLGECYRVLKPGGIASHVFDHRDHLYHADKQWPFLAHLAMPDPIYTLLCGHPLGYHNRLTPTQIMALFAACGFERIAVRQMILPDNRYVEGENAMMGQPGLSRQYLAHRFRCVSDSDLRTAAAHYLYRKPICPKLDIPPGPQRP
jgi:SAM-dependent methyltransferase